MPASDAAAVQRVLGALRAKGFAPHAQAIRALYDSPGFVLGSPDAARQVAFLYDAAVTTNAPWPVLQTIENFLPPGWRLNEIAPAPNVSWFNGIFGLTTGYSWSRRRLNRTVASLLRAPGNPDVANNRDVATDEAIRVILRGRQHNRKDVDEPYSLVQQHALDLAANLDTLGLPWTAEVVRRNKVLADYNPWTQVTPGRVGMESLQAGARGFESAGGDLVAGAKWAIPLAVGLAVTYTFLGPAIATVYADAKSGAKKAAKKAESAATTAARKAESAARRATAR